MGRASLKLAHVLLMTAGPQVISRPYGPGLIEASGNGRIALRKTSISRPYGPGLIEAVSSSVAVLRERWISRPYGPGLIEAV